MGLNNGELLVILEKKANLLKIYKTDNKAAKCFKNKYPQKNNCDRLNSQSIGPLILFCRNFIFLKSMAWMHSIDNWLILFEFIHNLYNKDFTTGWSNKNHLFCTFVQLSSIISITFNLLQLTTKKLYYLIYIFFEIKN